MTGYAELDARFVNRACWIAILRLRTNYYNRQRSVGLEPFDMSLMDMVLLGQLEERPHDMTSLSEILGLRRKTVSDHVEDLIRRKFLCTNTAGRRRCVYLTGNSLDVVAKHHEELIHHMQEIYKPSP